jgi:predicted O-linked N-acetylglucosamine transferase (SPINDLY family)
MPNTVSLQDFVNELITLFGMGRFADVEQRARTALRSFPDTPIVCELLGMALGAQYRYRDALIFLDQAIRGEPNDPQFWENLGQCQRQLNQLEAAENSLRRALALRPGWTDTLQALAEVLRALGRHRDVQKTLDEVLAADPSYARRQVEEREQHLRRAIAAQPRNGAFHDDLGLLQRLKGDSPGAERSFRRALDCDPTYVRAQVNLALLLSQERRDQEAMAAARAALGLLGSITAQISDERLEFFAHAAFVLDMSGASAEAVGIYKTVYQLKKDPSLALPMIYAARRACDWQFASRVEQDAGAAAWTHLDARKSSPGHLLGLNSAKPLDQLAAAQSYARQVSQNVPKGTSLARISHKSRLRVSYFSRDFYTHATAVLLVGVIEAHDRERFEIVAHDFSPIADSYYRKRLAAAFDRVIPIHEISDEAAAQRIATDEVDLIVDLNGWTTGHRAAVLAMRPAPVQIQWLGYPGTMGAHWIDYVVADSVIVPRGPESYFSEKIIRLPHSYQPNDNQRPIGERLQRRDYGLPDSAFVFCCFNQAFKITPEIFSVWMRLLHATPNSVLWLLESSSDAVAALRGEAVAQGISADRLVLGPNLPFHEHLARAGHSDLALDCFPYGSHTTASDMLWSGVPLIGLSGDTFASRVSASVLTAAGMPDLITTSIQDYFELAQRLATDREQLNRVRSRVERCRESCALFDTEEFTRDLETAFSAAHERRLAGLPPDDIDILP